MVAIRVQRGAAPRVDAIGTWSLGDPELSAHLRRFRRDHHLPQHLRVAMWPQRDARGVVPLFTPDDGPASYVPTLTALKAREAAAPLVRAGYIIDDAVPVRRAALGVARRLGLEQALTIVANRHGAVLTAGDDSAHLAWPAGLVENTSPNGLLARYRLIAALAPHVRHVMGPRTRPMVACGDIPGLRSFVLPLVEEFDQEVVVLDQPDDDLPAEEGLISDPDQQAALQVAAVVALGTDQ